MSTWRIFLLIAIVFAVIYSCSLTLGVVEGDDATTIAFQTSGRNPDLMLQIQYHSMFEYILSFLPARAEILWKWAVGLSAISAVFFTTLLVMLSLSISGLATKRDGLVFSMVLLLSVPEIIYLGLIYDPSIVSMAFILWSHIIFRSILLEEYSAKSDYPVVLNGRKITMLTLATLMFGLGVSFRWSMIVYAAVIAFDMQLIMGLAKWRRSLAFISYWMIALLCSTFLFLAISGYGPTDLYDIAKGGLAFTYSSQSIGPGLQERIEGFFRSYPSFLTPAFVLLFLFGIIQVFQTSRPTAYLWCIATIVALPFASEPKFFLPAWPLWIAVAYFGFRTIWYRDRSKLLWRTGFLLLLVLPWFVGLQVNIPRTLWGPGFEVRRADTVSITEMYIRLGLKSGSALPTSEGPRPLWGHFYTLFGGDWRDFVKKQNLEIETAVQTGIEKGYPIMAIRAGVGGSVALCLNRMGYLTTNHYTQNRQIFYNNQTNITVLKVKNLNSIDNDSTLHNAFENSICIFGYSSDLRMMYNKQKENFTILGPFTAIHSEVALTE